MSFSITQTYVDWFDGFDEFFTLQRFEYFIDLSQEKVTLISDLSNPYSFVSCSWYNLEDESLLVVTTRHSPSNQKKNVLRPDKNNIYSITNVI